MKGVNKDLARGDWAISNLGGYHVAMGRQRLGLKKGDCDRTGYSPTISGQHPQLCTRLVTRDIGSDYFR